jgi:hypothetical protein
MNIYAIGEPIFLQGKRSRAMTGRNACPTNRPPALSIPATSRSGGEAFAAGAMRDGIRVRNFKTAFLQVVTEIED